MGVGNVGFVLLFNLRVRWIWGRTTGGRWRVFIMQHRYNSNKITRSGLAYWPDGDTHYVAMQKTHSSNLNLGFSCPRSEKKRRNTVDCAFKSEEGNYVCYNHRYFCWKVWTRFSENKSGSFLQWCYRVTGPCSKRRKSATSHTAAEANNRRTRQDVKGCVKKRRKHPSVKSPSIRKGSGTLYVEGTMCEWQPPRMKTMISVSITSHGGSLQDRCSRMNSCLCLMLFPWPGSGRPIIQLTP